jgi:glycosyltransferase involved in cell wall biosynthesis
VTPVYNGAAFLRECIESVLAQTYDNWEYAICDNCSTDESREIALEYAERDPRIRVVPANEHVAAVPSMSRAMRAIPPGCQYVKVVHADDWLFPECIERMVAVASEHPPVGIVGAYRLAERNVECDGLPSTESVVDGREVGRRSLLGSLRVFGSPTSTLLRADLVRARDPFYDDAIINADWEVCYALLRGSDFGFVHQVLTFTRHHDQTVTSRTTRSAAFYVGRFVMLERYGPYYLGDEEYRRRLTEMTAGYLAYLARRPTAFRDARYRAMHVALARRLLRQVSAGQLGRALGSEAARVVARVASPPS